MLLPQYTLAYLLMCTYVILENAWHESAATAEVESLSSGTCIMQIGNIPEMSIHQSEMCQHLPQAIGIHVSHVNLNIVCAQLG